jgi:sugar O-acyltransferase (sialic acid O-acetyltransferase NeuD family)
MEKTDWIELSKINESPIAIFGAGGYGKEVFCTLRDLLNYYNMPFKFLGFFDDGLLVNSHNGFGEIVGGIKDLNDFGSELNLFLAVANPTTRRKIVEMIDNGNIKFPNLVFYDIRIFDIQSIKLGRGNIIFSKTSISFSTDIGNFNIFNGNISVGHDTTIGSFNTLLPGARLSGIVKVKDLNQFGMNTVVVQKIKIGNGNVFAPSSVVLRDIKDDGTYFQGTLKKL